MRLTPHTLMTAIRGAAVLGAISAAIALTGPFKYSDLHWPFPDTFAHAILFYGLTILGLGALPRHRAQDVALAAVAIGAASELAQGLVGREMSFHDLFGDSLGVAVAYGPVLVGRLRDLARTHPHVTFADLRRMDRRQGRERVAAKPAVEA
jgi:hypothetical protein